MTRRHAADLIESICTEWNFNCAEGLGRRGQKNSFQTTRPGIFDRNPDGSGMPEPSLREAADYPLFASDAIARARRIARAELTTVSMRRSTRWPVASESGSAAVPQ